MKRQQQQETHAQPISQPTIAFIGAGNMACSLIGGLLNDGYSAERLWASCRTEKTLARIQQQFGVHVSSDNALAAAQAEIVVLAVKPDVLRSVLAELAPVSQTKKPLIVSIVAAIPIAAIQQWLGDEAAAVVRCMPNMPALVGCGASGLFASQTVRKWQKDQAESILRAVGIVEWCRSEADLDTITALSGSGPAYFFLLMEALQQAAISAGLSRETAKLLTLQTALGSARVALESDLELAELRQQVTSKGGTTEAAMESLNIETVHRLFSKAVAAAKARAVALSVTLTSA